jgi:hypothetical protein
VTTPYVDVRVWTIGPMAELEGIEKVGQGRRGEAPKVIEEVRWRNMRREA